MSKAKIIFSFNGSDIEIQCAKEELLKDICQKYSNKINKNINLLIFQYAGNILNFQLSFKDQANSIDKERNEMKVLVSENINNNNYIIAEIDIKDKDINKKIKIINSYEEYMRTYDLEQNKIYGDEDEIKKCKIKINDKLIPFNNFHKFKSKGKYIIKYSFKNNLKNTNSMFSQCKLLTNINFSHFNATNITNMGCMFYGCSSLKNINLSNFNTKNVEDMACMFYGCSSLTNIDLSYFNTNNATNLDGMFAKCSSLKNINLSNFNTTNAINMSGMFEGCSSLKI